MGSLVHGLRQVMPSKAFWALFALMLVVHQASVSSRKSASTNVAARSLMAYNGTEPDPTDPTPVRSRASDGVLTDPLTQRAR